MLYTGKYLKKVYTVIHTKLIFKVLISVDIEICETQLINSRNPDFYLKSDEYLTANSLLCLDSVSAIQWCKNSLLYWNRISHSHLYDFGYMPKNHRA